jgi:lysophospholipase L1-like esterase
MRGVTLVSAAGWVIFGFVIACGQMRGQNAVNQTPAPTAAIPQVTSPAPVPPASTPEEETAKQIASMEAKLEDWPQLGRYRTDNAALAPATEGARRVIFYGDSITDSWGRRADTGEFFPGKPYVNRGISGQTTPQMVVRFRQDVIDLRPAAVVILGGTNDIAGNTGPMTLQMTEDNFRSMIDLAKANGIQVIVASILPVADYPWKTGLVPAPKIRTLNDWLKGYCVNHSVAYLDYYSAMVGRDGGMKPGISFDGVHPNAQGYAIMAPLAQAAIDKMLGSK